jgi:DNA-binding CsgD family transcriptional regulator
MILGDMRRKELALSRIKRLASSGLPLEPFGRTVLDLVNDGVAHSSNRAILAGAGSHIDAYVGNTPEIAAAVPLYQRYFVDAPPEVSGVRFRYDAHALGRILPSRVFWQQEDLVLPDFHRAEGYNTVYRPLGWHHFVQVVFQEGGEFLGYSPIWRGADQKPFSGEDIAFLRMAASHISHGLRAARLVARDSSTEIESFAPLSGWGSGVILTDRKGKLIAIDSAARLIFQQVGIHDDPTSETFWRHPVRESLEYITRTIESIFHGPELNSLAANTPVSRVYVHWAGIVLRLRGVLLIGTDGREYINVLVERGETTESRRQRLIFRWGLSSREAEILWMIGEGRTGPEISILLRISHDTARKHTSRILEKLGVETRTAAAAIALTAAPLESI